MRIDAVHYCDRELDLARQRKRKSFTGRGGESREPAKERLMLFARTVRENDVLAQKVEYLKTPYMMRESCMAELARTVTVLPNLRYVDLPDSFYSAASSSTTLRSELQARCADLRTMIYRNGAEDSFALLGPGGLWQNIEVLELDNLSVDPATLGYVLASLPALRQVVLVHLDTLDNASMGSLPPVAQVTLRDFPSLSIEGVANYFSHVGVDSILTSLTLTNTAIAPSTLNQILASAPHLIYLSMSKDVSHPFPAMRPPLLASKVLKTLHYEIFTVAHSRTGAYSPSESYYAYLATSIHAGGLPVLCNLYALSETLPSLLLKTPTQSGHRPGLSLPSNEYSDRPSARSSSGSENQKTLNVFTKSISEMEWNLTLVSPPRQQWNENSSPTRTRPVSLYQNSDLSPQWRGTGRTSVRVGNGFGGYLMVPTAENVADGGENGGSAGAAPLRSLRKNERDAWMG